VTSPTGAAIRDILHILSRRFPPAAVLIYQTLVQGDAAVAALSAAIAQASARAECDVLIVARGGGSLEDLWAFNSERVARAIHACAIPVVSGVGHEIDFTIADFVADARAPTPSAAAELVVPDRAACLEALSRTLGRLAAGARRELRAVQARFGGAEVRLNLAHPGVRLRQQVQRLDDLEQRLAAAMRTSLRHERARVSEIVSRLVHRSPAQRVRENQLQHSALAARLQHAILKRLGRSDQQLKLAVRSLDAYSPLSVLTRGYAVVKRSADGTVIRDADTVSVGEEIRTQLARGLLTARVTGKE
jgi:exodeoxyribonuclease VII large subunit